MRIPTLLMTSVLAAGLVYSQDKPAEKPSEANFEAAIIPVKTLSGDSFNRLVTLLGVVNARLSGSERLRTIVVYAPKDVIAQVRHVIEELDRPGSEAAIGRNIEMTVTLLRCFAKPIAEAGTLPSDLESVGRQLKATNLCKDVQVWDTVPLRLQEGKQSSDDSRLPGPGPNPPTVRINVQPEAVIRKDQGRYVRFANLNMDFMGQNQQRIWTAGDFMEGQKTVIGKVAGSDEDSIFAVISLKILD
jgi:hypothetical protein